MVKRFLTAAGAAGVVLIAGACGGGDGEGAQAVRTDSAAAQTPPPPPAPTLRLEVDAASKQLRIYRNDQVTATFGVAVGRPEWPTQNGEWKVTQVVWNPGWTPPPDEEWTKDEEPKDPGDPDNPLGTVQIVYDPPRTIHGTNQPESIGTAASHGSIRMRNEDAEQVARMIMDEGGASRDAGFFSEVKQNRTRRVEIPIPNAIPIRVINGADNADAVEGERDGNAASSSAPAAPAPAEPRREAAPAKRAPAPPAADSAGGDTAHHHH